MLPTAGPPNRQARPESPCPLRRLPALFGLNIGLTNDAAVLFLLLTQMGRKLRARLADWLETLQSPFWFEFGREHCGVAPLPQLIDHGRRRAGRREQAVPDADLIAGTAGSGACRYVRHPFERRRRTHRESL